MSGQRASNGQRASGQIARRKCLPALERTTTRVSSGQRAKPYFARAYRETRATQGRAAGNGQPPTGAGQ